MYDGLYGGNLRVGAQGGEARPDHRLAQNLAILLGPVPAGAQSPASGHDNGCNHARHWQGSE
jgi:hypothetical protein